jgi:two-component system chemotaxis response regulator CheY
LENRLKILVVDDSETVRAMVTGVLSGAGFDVLQAEDGVHGAMLIATTPDLALVVCDVKMPRVGGLEMLRVVRANSGPRRVGVMMLTSEARPDLIARGRSLGVLAWMVKPLRPELLLATIRKLIRSRSEAQAVGPLEP